MSGETRSAVLVFVLAVAVVVGAAHRGSPDGGSAGTAAAAEAASVGPAKSMGIPGPHVQPDVPAPMPEVDELGTQHLTGHDGKTVALTFDDGPHPDHTPEVLSILREYGVVATFCVVAPNVDRQPDLVRDIVADGHALCNHTVTHDVELPSRDAARIDDEINSTVSSVSAAAPEAEVPFYRAPGGNFSANVNAVAETYGEAALGWSIDAHDWKREGVRQLRDRVISEMHPGAVVLLHDGGGDRSETVAALPRIIEALQAADYEFVVPTS